MVRGDAKTALARPYTVVLTERTAKIYFGADNPVGKFLKFGEEYDFEVTGVVKDVPQNSHIQFDLLCSLETYFTWNRGARDSWFGNFIYYTYVRLVRPEARELLEAKFPGLVEEKMGSILKALKADFRFHLQPLTEIHLRSKLQWEYGPNGDVLYVYIFAAVAVVILAIACVNFINLATARSARRAREVGLRKVVGAGRGDLIAQFLGESIGTSLLALLLALIFSKLALPLFKALSGIEITLGVGQLPWLIPVFAGLVLITGFAAGSYPAFYLSSFRPAKTLKAGSPAGSGNARFRRVLVVSQFVLSIAMIIGTRTIADQIRYLKNKDLGFQKDQVLSLRLAGGQASPPRDLVKARLKEIPGILNAAATVFIPGQDQSAQSIDVVVPEGHAENTNLLFRRINTDADYVRTMGIVIVRGRDFSAGVPSDPKDAILLNEEAVRKTGWADPIGKTVKILMENNRYETKTVVGVVKDFHISSLRDAIEPVYISNDVGGSSNFVVKLRTDDAGRLLGEIKKVWRALSSGGWMDYFFIDANFEALYRSEERLNKIFSSFSVLSALIACLGLFGLASFLAEQRKKEIGIRKVLGASVGGVVGLLSREFLKLVGLAAFVAWPIAYFVMSTWLRGFAYRTRLSPWTFLGSGAAALAIAFLTVGWQATRAALANPVDSLKYE
jgi:putative ABC transport system permease protein